MDSIQEQSTAEVEEEKHPICPDYWSENWPDSIPGPDQYVPVEKEPAPLNLSEVMAGIGYPANGLGNGQVVLRILVDRQGRYNRHIVRKNPSPWLTQAVTSKVHEFQFSPAIRNGKPVWYWVTVPFNFRVAG